MNWYTIAKKKKKNKKNTNKSQENSEFYFTGEDGVLMYKTPSMETAMIADGSEENKIPHVES